MAKQPEYVEVKLIDVVIALFRTFYTGQENAVKTDKLLFELAKMNYPINGRTLRAIIGYIRRNDVVSPGFIVSNVASGYWFTSYEREMRNFLEKQLNRMSNQFLNVKHLKQRITKSQKNIQNIQVEMFA